MSTIIDILLLLIIVKAIFTGFKRGLFREILDILAVILSVIISFLFMYKIADLFYQTLPFFNLKILGVSIVAINIFLYQVLAFILLASIIYALINIIISITGLVKKAIALKLSPQFDLISSIFGGVLGALNGYVIVFALLIIVSPFLNNFSIYRNSTVKNIILYKSPILTNRVDKYTSALQDVSDLTEEISKDKKKLKHSNEYNLKSLDIMLKYKVVKLDTIESLKEANRLSSIDNIDSVLNKYKQGEKND